MQFLPSLPLLTERSKHFCMQRLLAVHDFYLKPTTLSNTGLQYNCAAWPTTWWVGLAPPSKTTLRIWQQRANNASTEALLSS